MRRYVGKVALITAAAQGIGAAIARRIVAEGGSVLITDLQEDKLNQLADELNAAQAGTAAGAQGGASGAEGSAASRESGAGSAESVGRTGSGAPRAVARRADVTVRADVEAAVAAAVERFGQLDLLVNNAGGCFIESVPEDTTDEDWHAQLDLTLVSASRCIQAALPYLVKTRGNVVTISSVNGIAAFGNFEYAAAKAGQLALTQNYAARYGELGVRFNAVAPATVRTPNWDDQQDSLARLAKLYPLGRIAEPEDIAAAVAFLGSADAAWITGHTLPVDGGILTGPGLFDLSPSGPWRKDY